LKFTKEIGLPVSSKAQRLYLRLLNSEIFIDEPLIKSFLPLGNYTKAIVESTAGWTAATGLVALADIVMGGCFFLNFEHSAHR